MCIWDLQCFQGFRNCCLFCTYWLNRNFYSGHEQPDKYGKHSLNHHFQHCAHCVYEIYIVLKLFEIAVCFAHLVFFEIWTPLILTMLAMVNVLKIIISIIAHSVYMRFTVFQSFPNCYFFCTFFLLRNFYSGDAPHANYGKHCLTHHFQHCANCVYEIYIVLELFEIPVCFAHFGLLEILTPLIVTMLAMVNVVHIIISNIAHSVYMRFTVFSKFSKLLFVLHIFAYSKFILRSWATC